MMLRLLVAVTVLSAIGDFLKWEGWGGLTAIVLFATLVVLCFYTWATYRIAKLQQEEVGLRKRPIIVVTNRKPSEPMFLTRVINMSNVYVIACVKAQVTWHGTSVQFHDGHHYSGERKWLLQPNQVFDGHLDLANYLSDQSLNPIDSQGARVRLEARVRNYHDSGKEDVFIEIPPVEYYREGKVWVPEAAFVGTSDLPESATPMEP